MPLLSRLLSSVALSVIALAIPGGGVLAQTFNNPIVSKDAERLDAQVKAAGAQVSAPPAAAAKSAKSPAVPPAASPRQTGLKLLAEGDARGAAVALKQAVAADTKSAEAWHGLAKALLAIEPDKSRGEAHELPAQASGAAFRAFERSTDAGGKAAALVTLAEALKRRSLYRPAIDALKSSLVLADNGEVRQAYDKLRNEHGFRMVDYKIEADAAEPRLCLNFSERLGGQQSDLAKFVTLDGRDPQSVSAEGRQVCIEGLAHGKRYTVKVRAGLPAETAEQLIKDVEIAAYVRDRSPAVRVSGRAYVLPSRGQQGLPVVTVNTTKVTVEIYRVGDRGLAPSAGQDNFLKELQRHDIEAIRDRSGQKIWSGELDVAAKVNEEVTTAIPIGEAVPKMEPGAYILETRIPRKSGASSQDSDDDNGGSKDRAAQWFIVSDLGLTALTGADGLHGFVRALSSSDPMAGVTVKLVAKNNEILGTAKTDAAGYVKFDAGLKRGEGGLAPALLIAETGQDYAFLDLAASALDLGDRGIKGREVPGAIDGYVYAERGVYRPGEAVNLTALVRDKAGRAASLPATLIVTRPDGVEHRRLALADQGLGGRTTELRLARGAMTGTWRAKLHTDPKADPIAQVSFLVEDFVPERLDLKLEPATKTISPGDAARINIGGRFLYGPPAANLDLEGEVVVKPAAGDIEGFAGYKFGRADERITAVRRPLEELPQTDANGAASVSVRLPQIARTARPLEADVLIRLREPGGRTVERRTTLPVAMGEPRIGVKPLYRDGTVGEGQAAEHDLILVGADGKVVEGATLTWQVSRLDQRWVWYHRDGQWGYEPVSATKKLQQGTVKSEGGKPARISLPVEWGRYRIDVTSGAGVPMTSVVFQSGWHQSESADSPEMLDIALDKASYKAGETARLKIVSREAGKAQIAVLGSGLLAQRQIDVPAGGAEVALEVKEDWLPGAYATATLYRALDEKSKRMPSRAVGVRWLPVDSSGQTLKVALEAPAKVRPASKLTVPIKVAGVAAGDEARVTVAAVDVGILNLTRFESPAPEKWFHAQRRLGFEVRDLYGRLIDGMRAERGRLRSGGDGGAGMSLNGAPQVETLLSLYSGIVKVGADGTAKAEFDLPDFNGTVRLMAVAWSNGKVGSGQADIVVRDQVALTVSAPRFLTLGDAAQLSLDVHNVEGPADTYKVAVEQELAGAKSNVGASEIALKVGERRRETVTLKPSTLGAVAVAVRVTGPGGVEVRRELTFDVKPPAGDIKRSTVASLAANGGKLAISKDILTDLIPGTARVTMSVGPTASLDVPSLLTQLDRYPYGCAEQTTSRALPLLYVNDMAKRIGMATDAQIRERVQAAVDRVLEMQDASGAFGVWGPSSGGGLWLTAYVTDFLTRAKETGYAVRPQPFNQALDKLQNFLGFAQDFEKGGEARAYALYVLARNGRAQIGDLRYYVDTRLDRFSSPLAQAQLGAALAMAGEKERAEKAFGAAVKRIADAKGKADDDMRSDYGSLVRDGAGVLTLASETRIWKTEAPSLAGVLAEAYRSRQYTSTQEQAWMLLAARALSDDAKATTLSVNGAEHKGELIRSLTPAELEAGPLSILNNGESTVDAVVTVTGSSLTPEPPIAKGFKIERSYYTLDGKPVDLKSATGGTASLAQNQRLVVVLKIEGEKKGGRVLLADRLPAGLEIENPRLVDSGDLKGLDWLQRTHEPEHTEFRDDRFVAAFNFFGEERDGRRGNGNGDGAKAPSATVAYIVRAVTPGSFVHPSATVEDMYRPEQFARTATGRLEITPKVQ